MELFTYGWTYGSKRRLVQVLQWLDGMRDTWMDLDTIHICIYIYTEQVFLTERQATLEISWVLSSFEACQRTPCRSDVRLDHAGL